MSPLEAAEARVAAAITDGTLRVPLALAPSGPADPDARAFEQIAGIATVHDLDREEWAQARLCDCTDATHPDPEPGTGDAVWFWTADVAQVKASRVFYGGGPHVLERTRAVTTGHPKVVAP